MITVDDIVDSFSSTTESSRVSLVGAFEDENGEKANSVYSILQNFPPHLGLGSVLIHSDGGIKDFYIVRNIGEYQVIFARFQYNSEMPFNTPFQFAGWLNNHEKKFEASVVLGYIS